MPDGTIIQNVPEGITQSQLSTRFAKLTAPTAPAAPQDSTSDQVLRQIALQGRAASEGVTNTLALPIDAQVHQMNALKLLWNKVFGTHLPDIPTPSELLSASLTAAGAPVPETPTEQMTTAITRGVTGGLTGGAAFSPTGAMGAANAVRTALSGASGAAASEGVRQAGGGPVAQSVAGVAGGFAPTAVESAARGTAALAAPFFRKGQENIAGRTIAAAASSPEAAAAKAATSQEIVPGSQPTLAEATQDPGLAAFQSRLKSLSPGDFSAQESAQNQARQTLLEGMSKTPDQIKQMVDRRDAVTGALRNQAFAEAAGKPAPVSNITDTIDSLLANPENAGKSVQAALKDVRGQIEGQTDVRALYAVRKEINRVLEGRYVGADESVLRYAGSQLGQVKDAIDSAIGEVAPTWDSYLTKYSQLSRPIERAQTLGEIQSKTSAAAPDLRTGMDVLSQPKWRQVVGKNQDELSQLLTKGQMTKLNQIAADLDRGVSVAAVGKTRGSDTAANLAASDQLSIANVIGQTFGTKTDVPNVLLGTALRPLSWLYKLPESRIRQIIVQAMTDPQLGAQLLKRANAQNVSDFSNRLTAMLGGTAGAEVSAAAGRSQSTETAQSTNPTR